MKVKRITLRDYRNYAMLDLPLAQNLHIFLGENAQGKTNILESVYLAAMGRSHRTNDERDLIRWEQPGASAAIRFERAQVEQEVKFRFWREKPKEILLSGAPIRMKELVGHMNCVLFSPEDLSLVKGAPAGRRGFLDGELSQASAAYYGQLARYQRLLAQRNQLLKKIRERRCAASQLEVWDEQLAPVAAGIVRKRREAVKKLNMLANLTHRRISASRENLEIEYFFQGSPEGGIPENLEIWYNEIFNRSRDLDIARGSTSVGPHRDDLVFKVNGADLRSFGSQGQQRTGALSLKLAELEFMKSETGEYPVLLLDDVMSELDAGRREHLLAFIKDRVQTLVTATDRHDFPPRLGAAFCHVSAGRIVE